MNKKTRHKYDFKKSHTLNKTKSKQNDMQSMLLSIDNNNNSQTGGANPPSTWFESIFGFDENLMLTGTNPTKMPTKIGDYFTIKTETIDANDTNAKDNYLSSLSALFSSSSDDIKVKVQKHTLICSNATNAPPGFKEQYIGMFDRPTLAQLEQCIKSTEYKKDFKKLKEVNIKGKKIGTLAFKHIETPDVALLHCDPKNEGAIFQVASQFNCLEMINVDTTPNQGVTIYSDDHTQGPACAMACPAALVYRNYFVEHTKNGQTHKGQCSHQIDNLEDINILLGNMNGEYWTMTNGYVIVNDDKKLGDISNKIVVVERENIIQALRVGVHWSTSIVDYLNITTNKKPLDHRVCQVYASALPVSLRYNGSITNIDLWEPFATCILEASYMATLCIAALIAIKSQTRIKCYLTLIGGGAFENKPGWIINAIKKALKNYKDYPIDVMLVHHNSINTEYSRRLTDIGKIITDLSVQYEALAIKAGPGPGEATLKQQEIFTKFETDLENYDPPSNLDYKEFGQIIVEGRQVIDKRTKKTDYVRTKRVAILVDTLKLFEKETPIYYNLAKENMLNWCKNVRPRNTKGLEVIVEPIDWGEMALKCTKNYGSIFACLNMANSETPGGGYATGPAAQEENMFRRTNCHFSIIRDEMLVEKKDENNNPYYFYNKKYEDLIGAKDGENTYIDKNPRICIKDKETWNLKDGNTPEGTQNIGYDLYDASNIFLFYELRCAAVNIKSPDQFNETEMRNIIHAQFKTLKEKGIRHAILGAFGCGAFNNPPLEVAALYKKYLIQYKDDFDVIAFPIYFAGSGEKNYPSFRKILLNDTEEPIHSIFYNGEANGAEAIASGAEASESPNVVTPIAANAAAIASAIKKNKTSVKKGHEKAGTGKAGKVITGTEKAAKAGTDEAGSDEAAKAAKPATDEVATHKVVKSVSQENDLRQAGRKDLAQSGSADNGTVNGNVSDENGTPSPSFDISPEGSNGQGMLIGFLILCTLGIGAVSFIK